MKELGENARVFCVYNDEATILDFEFVEGHRSTLDTQIIFAGLFSAVVASFVALSIQNLQQDYSEVSASLLTELVSLQRTIATGGNISLVSSSPLTHDTPFIPSKLDVWTNGLWFVSLTITLSIALFSGLIKQWLHYYVSDNTGSPKKRACTRQFRNEGLSIWAVSAIIELLQAAMSISLLLFFIGLVLFTRSLDGTVGISIALIVFTSGAYVFTLGTSSIPLWIPQCPYKTSLTKIISLRHRIFWIASRSVTLVRAVRSYYREAETPSLSWIIPFLIRNSSLSFSESKVVISRQDSLQLDLINEMATQSTNSSVSSIATQSLGALHAQGGPERSLPILLWVMVKTHFNRCFRHRISSGGSAQYELTAPLSDIERYSRALLCLPSKVYVNDWDKLRYFASLASNDLHANALHAFMINGKHLSSTAGDVKELLGNIFGRPPIPVSELHPWLHQQFTDLSLSAMQSHSPLGKEDMCLKLIKNLTLETLPTFQDELMIRCLYADLRIAEEHQIRLDLDSISLNPALSRKMQLYSHLIELMPDLARCALSTGEEESKWLYDFLRTLFKLPNESQPYGRSKLVSMALWNTVTIILPPEGLEDSEDHALLRLLHVLVSAEHQDYAWENDISVRFDLIIRLHDLLFVDYYDEATLFAVLHWILVVSSSHQLNAGNTDHLHGADGVLEDKLREFLVNQLSKHGPRAYNSCCSFITSRDLPGPLNVITDLLLLVSQDMVICGKQEIVLSHLDWLFHHFLPQDNLDAGHSYSVSLDDSVCLLNSLVDFVSQQSYPADPLWRKMLFKWLSLIEDRLDRISEIELSCFKRVNDTTGYKVPLIRKHEILHDLRILVQNKLSGLGIGDMN